MFFFRETPFYLKTKNPQSEKALGVFINLKVTVKGEVNSESGMILNLKNLDFALESVKKNFPVMKSKPTAFFKIYKQLQNLLGDYFFGLEMSWDQHTLVKNKKESFRVLRSHVWFLEADTDSSAKKDANILVKRPVQLRYKGLNLPLVQKIRSVQSGCHLDDFKILMKRSKSNVREIRISYPEKNAELVLSV